MRFTRFALKSSASSSRWLARQSKDPYVRSRAPGNPTSSSGDGRSSSVSYRSRSSFKLLSLAAKHPILSPSTRSVVDLGAAPGGWSQVAAHLLRARRGAKSSIIAVDILGMEPLPFDNVVVLKGDFLSEEIREQVRTLALRRTDEEGQGVDTVLSDMMAPMSGNRTRDVALSLDLCSAATVFARDVLKRAQVGEQAKKTARKAVWPGGNLVMKFFAHPDLDEFKKLELDPWFGKVVVEKPKGSRSELQLPYIESSEAYFVCLGFKGDPATR